MSTTQAMGKDVRGEGGAVPHLNADSPYIVQAIRQAGRRLPTLIEDIPTGVLVAYGVPDFPVIVVNSMAEELLGCSRKELLGLPAGGHTVAFKLLRASAPVPSDSEGLPLFRTTHFGEVVRDEEWTVVRADGGRSVVLVDTNPIRDSSRQIAGGIVCLRDITRLRGMEDALRESEQCLRDADQRKDQFLATLAHELRGPLAPARSVAEILKNRANNDPELAKLADVLDRQITAIKRLLDDVLDLSRVAAGKLRLESRVVDLAPALEQALEWTRPAITARGHRLAVKATSHRVCVNADGARLAQVFANLLTNAAKYTDPSGTIEVEMKTEGSHAVVIVRDTGRGLDESDMMHLFDLYFQPERTLDRAEGGLGIGLSLVRSLVRMHGGTVHATSGGRGKGSEFVVSLPLASTRADDPGP